VLPLSSLGSTLAVPQVPTSISGSVQKARTVSKPAATSTRSTVSHTYVAPSHTATARPSATPAARVNTPGDGSPNTPAMHGTNPHGQGTVASVSTSPSTSYPYTYAPGGSGGEQVVVGRGRSEQNPDGTYHAHTTILALFGTEVLGVDAPQGQSNTGPLNAVQTGILDALCNGSGNQICLTVLKADTSASPSGANTSFSVAHATVGGTNGIDAGAGESSSSISGTSTCQTASGSSSLANANVGGHAVVGLAQSSESSKACQGQAPSQQASSSDLSLGGNGIPIPAPGCANGTPNTITNIGPLLTIICGADSMAELAAPSGVREALTVIVLPAVGTALAKTVVAASESHAVAPPASTTTNSCTDSDQDCLPGTPGASTGPPLTSACPGFPADNVDTDGDCDHSTSTQGQTTKCTDSDKDCGKGPAGTGKCTNDKTDSDGDCQLASGGKETSACPDKDTDCGIGPAGTGKCTVDSYDGDGDCVLSAGGSETGAVSGASTKFVGLTSTKSTNAASTLPFTGENVLELILIGLLLAATGLTVRWGLERKRAGS